MVEGYYGVPWSWEDRTAAVRFLASVGYRFFLYAPKTVGWLRRGWKEDTPAEEARGLGTFAAACRGAGVRFGVGLTPWGILDDPAGEARSALARKLDTLADLGVEELALLFDDMDGREERLAARQATIVEFVRGRWEEGPVTMCPTYYSDDPILDQVFGARPPDYLAELGRSLHPDVGVFWTGPEVVSREISAGHVGRVAEVLGRPPVLWDNYPVNDGQRMSEFLHLRAFTGRRRGLTGEIRAHAVNPALQPTLSCIPLATLPDAYRLGDAYDYARSFEQAAERVLGVELAAMVRDDLLQLQDVGRSRLGDEREARLRDRYGAVDHPAAREIVRWLDGGYAISDEEVRTQ